MFKHAALGFALAVVLTVADASSAHAKAVFSVQPSKTTKTGYFVLPGSPGATIQSAIEVLNTGDQAGSASIYAVDGTTGQTSGAVYRSRQEKRKDVGSWIQLSKTSVTLPAHSKETIPFTVSVPSDAFAGQHLGGIVAAPANLAGTRTLSKTKRSSFQVKIRELSVVAVQVNLPGPQVVKMAITGIHASGIPGRQSILIGLSNVGNVFVKGKGSLTIADSSGKKVKQQDFPIDTFVSHTHVDLPVYTAGKPLANGSYMATVAITYQGHRLVRTFPFDINTGNQKQVFGAPAGQPVASSSSSNTLLYILIGAGVLLLAAIAFGLYRYLLGEGYI
jgi:hypothetical protein